MYLHQLPSNPTSRRERLTLTTLTCLIGLITGGVILLAFNGIISVPEFSMPPALSVRFWVSIPATCIVWVMLRFRLPQRDLAIMLVVMATAAIWIYWLSTRQEPVFMGHVLMRAQGLVDVIAFDAFLLAVMATTDLIMLKPWTSFLVIVAIIIYAVPLYPSSLFGLRLEAGLNALRYMVLVAIMGCIILETIYLLFREFSAEPVEN